jgi:hypothetical protein
MLMKHWLIGRRDGGRVLAKTLEVMGVMELMEMGVMGMEPRGLIMGFRGMRRRWEQEEWIWMR